MASSISFTRWAIAAVAAAVILTGIVIISPVGSLLGVRLAPGLPFRIIQVGQNNDRILYRNELTPIQWDVSPENAAAYPGETIALCPPSVRQLTRSCIILTHYTPNNGRALVFTPPILSPGSWNLVLQAWTVANTFVATGPSAAVPVTVADRGAPPVPAPSLPPAKPSPSVPVSDQCPPGAWWCPTPPAPAPSPVSVPSPSVPVSDQCPPGSFWCPPSFPPPPPVPAPLPLPSLAPRACTAGCDVDRNERALVIVNYLTERDRQWPLFEVWWEPARSILINKLSSQYGRTRDLYGNAASANAVADAIVEMERDPLIEAVDVVVMLHGDGDGSLLFADRTMKVNGGLSELIAQKRQIACTSARDRADCVANLAKKDRMVLNYSCFGASQFSGWRAIGFKAIDGARGISADGFVRFPTEIDAWSKGYAFGETVDHGNAADPRRLFDTVGCQRAGFSGCDSFRLVSGASNARQFTLWTKPGTLPPNPRSTPTPTPAVVPAQVSIVEPVPGTMVPASSSWLRVRLQRFLGSTPGLTCESWRLQRPDGTVVTLTAADWLQAPARLAPPCAAL